MLPISTAEKCEAVLNEHAATENPPTFLFECLNGHQQRELLRIKEGLDKGSDLENMDKVFDAVESHLQGWEHMGIEYTKGCLSKAINYLQCLELLGQLVFQRPSMADKKKSKSPSPSNTVKPAKPAKGQNVSGSSPNTPAGT